MPDTITTLTWTTGDRMTKARKAAGISVEDMAERFAVNRHTIGRWESDKTKPTKAVLLVWSQITECPFDWLVGIEANPFGPAVTPTDLRTSRSGWELTMHELPLAA
jgi:transcriptional regulator with XRE-family HTH domain